MKKGLSFLSRLTQMSVDTVTAIGKDVMDSINEAGKRRSSGVCCEERLIGCGVFFLLRVFFLLWITEKENDGNEKESDEKVSEGE